MPNMAPVSRVLQAGASSIGDDESIQSLPLENSTLMEINWTIGAAGSQSVVTQSVRPIGGPH